MQIISVLTILVTLFFIIMNIQDSISINIISSQFSQILNLPILSYKINVGVLASILFLLGSISGLLFFAPIYTSLKTKYNAYKRELEKGSISNTNGEAKIKVLENKITVLEKALEDALKRM